MKCQIVTAEGTTRTCKCGCDLFRKSTKSKYNKDNNTGVTYELIICDKCGEREERNHINWVRGDQYV